jgi:serine/threonine-protein kinase HipA
MMMNNLINLSVYLNDYLIGNLTRLPDDRIHFYFTQKYLTDNNRPTLSQSFYTARGELLSDLPPTQTTAPSFFANLLPEGFLREYLAKNARLNPIRDFYLLQLLGYDLPGAVIIKSNQEELRKSTEREEELIVRDEEDRRILKFSLAGVQLKFSALMQHDGRLTIPAHGMGGDWIVKLPSQRFQYNPENEFSMLTLAREIGIDVPDIKLVEASTIENLPNVAKTADKIFIIKRFDRTATTRVHMEDFAQVYNVYPHEKYERVSYNNITNMLASTLGEDVAYEFIKRLFFNILIGNDDMHLKNISLIYPNAKTAQLSPAYDYVATHVFLDDGKIALSMNGEKNISKINLALLKRFAEKTNLPSGLVIKIAQDTTEKTVAAWHKIKKDLPLPKDMSAKIEKRLLLTAKQFT